MTPTEALNILTSGALLRPANGLTLQDAGKTRDTILQASEVLKGVIEPDVTPGAADDAEPEDE